MSNITSNIVQKGKNPLEQGKKTIADIFNKNKKILSEASFISTVGLSYKPDEYNLPIQNKFLHQVWDKTFLVEKKKNLLT